MTTITKQSIKAAKIAGLTDKQILAASRPKPSYYSQMAMSSRRACLWCRWSTKRQHHQHYGEYIPEPIMQLEIHYMEKHHDHS